MGKKRKLKIVNKETPVSELFSYFLKQVELFPGHQFRASWQQKQMAELIKNLPENHAVAVHDYSENYTCQHQDQIQSLYFGQTQVSIHVTVLHIGMLLPAMISHRPQSLQNISSSSPDVTHDSHDVHHNRELLAGYLKEIGYKVNVLHEWTDGCSAQYKSRHCMGDVSCSYTDFGFITIRNYFETSHAKGPQDGAGSNLKYHRDMAVFKRQVTIQDAKNLYDFADKEFRQPAPSSCSCIPMNCKGSIVAIASGDNEEDYYLLKVTKDGSETLERATTDDWGAKYRAGAMVMRTFFGESWSTTKEALVYVATVRFICQDLQQIGNEYKIDLKQHEEILSSLHGF
ncbi:hypothetical protein AC249_AIPGENE16598 [Exaiptasia diaphana]|nr:hypothetical protein AC249_AIPGENE16598 [Exaiptasia diaphana]